MDNIKLYIKSERDIVFIHLRRIHLRRSDDIRMDGRKMAG